MSHYVNPVPVLIGTGTYQSKKSGSKPHFDANVYAYSTADGGFRFELHWNGQRVGSTSHFRYVWLMWRCDVPVRYCVFSRGHHSTLTPKQEEERLIAARMKRLDPSFKVGDLVARGKHMAIIKSVDYEKLPLQVRLVYKARECTLGETGHVPVTVNGVPYKARWTRRDPDYLITVRRPFWRRLFA